MTSVFKAFTVQSGCHQKFAFNKPGKLEMNPPRADNEMIELSKEAGMFQKYFNCLKKNLGHN